MKKIIAITLIGFVLSVGLVFGANEGNVVNSVQPRVLAMSINKTAINWGNRDYGATQVRANTLTPDGTITISNIGTITGKISAKTDAQTDNASHLNKWTMSPTAVGVDTYKLAFMVDNSWPSPIINLTPTYQIIKSGIVAGANTTIEFWFGMPTAGTSLESQTWNSGFLFTE